MPRVRITPLDGKLPNVALMKLAHHHRARGDEVVFTYVVERDVTEGDYDIVYGSAIFDTSAARLESFLWHWPGAIVGGTGTASTLTVEQHLGLTADYPHQDYTDHPDFRPSIGFTSRGCRSRCGHCCVWTKEGRARSVATVADIWRGGGHQRKLHLLDNDFFGQPRPDWQARIQEIRDGAFHVCFAQGINVRTLTEEQAEAIASLVDTRTTRAGSLKRTILYQDGTFTESRLYTAWDNLRDESAFFRGVDRLERAGVSPAHLMAYMLVGFDRTETQTDIVDRFHKMTDRGIQPYPMPWSGLRTADPARFRELKRFQRWATTGLYRSGPFNEYDPATRRRKRQVAPSPPSSSDFSQLSLLAL
jgi:hypothetical protein